MADRKSFLLRVEPSVLEAMQRWANDDLRSLNAQVEFVLRDALRRAGRAVRPRGETADANGQPGGAGDTPGETPGGDSA